MASAHLPPESLHRLQVWMDLEHERVDQALARIECRLEQRAFPDAARRFEVLCVQLEALMAVEDQTLLPHLAGAHFEETVQLQAEHLVIRHLLLKARTRLANFAGNALDVKAAMSDLRELVGPHCVLERQLLASVRRRSDGDSSGTAATPATTEVAGGRSAPRT